MASSNSRTAEPRTEIAISLWPPNANTAGRLEASKLLAERGWGKAPAFAPVEEADPLGLVQIEQARIPSKPRR